MSEAGMALSNPYRPVEARTLGCVGTPLPGISAQVAIAPEGSSKLEPLVTVESPVPDGQVSNSTNKVGFVGTPFRDWLVEICI